MQLSGKLKKRKTVPTRVRPVSKRKSQKTTRKMRMMTMK